MPKEKEHLMHPSGLTYERWNWPFKTDAEREQIQSWINNTPKDLLNASIPF